MTTIVDVSSKLGEYMLKGWILTDNPCTTCHKVPLMRSPSGPVTYFCANCDESPTSITQGAHSSSAPSAPTTSSTLSDTSLDSTSHHSRPSTPPTEISSALSSPVFAPVDTEEALQRRQQSDTASTEIGKRLLKGWAMLADECPNMQCFGIPLVRPPTVGGEKPSWKECVICHTKYLTQIGHNGSEHLLPINEMPHGSSSALHLPSDAGRSTGPRLDKGKAAITRQPELSESVSQLPAAKTTTIQPINTLPPAGADLTKINGVNPLLISHSTLAALEASAAALERSLNSLTDRLEFLSRGFGVDAVSIGQTADAINKVTQALMQVKQLHWSESHACVS